MRKILSVLLVIFSISPVFAFLAGSEKYGYAIDFPEGFEITDMAEDESSIVFRNKYLEAETLIRVWEKSKFKDADEAMRNTMTRIEGAAEYQKTSWRRQDATIAMFDSPLLIQGGTASGWGFTASLPLNKGYLTVLSYTKKELSNDMLQFIISVLDSVMIDEGSYREPGIITSTFYPRENKKQISLKIGKKTIKTEVDDIDAEANQFVIDREFSIFKIYAENNLPEVFDAWIRFYRLVGRDATLRLKKVSFDINSALAGEARKKDSENPDAGMAQLLLNWVQDFEYERIAEHDPNKADMASIPAAIQGAGSDCDARSLLLAVIFKNMGIESCFFVSAEYSHAMVGVHLEGKQGQTMAVDGKEFLFGETTAKGLTFGLLDAQMQDRKKWIPVEIY